MNHLVSETLPAAARYPSSAHHGGHGLVDTLLNGFIWRIGSDAANMLFRSAPTIFVAAVLVVVVVSVVRRFKRRNTF